MIEGMPTPVEGRAGDWNTTYTGIAYFPLDPRPQEVCIEDIAHSLSLLCRFGGHCKVFYSVAEHSIRCAELLWEHDPMVQLWALVHDAAEAYLLDIPRPLKRSTAFAAYREVERMNVAVIAQALGLVGAVPSEVKRVDEIMLATEARDLMPPRSVAKWQFLATPLPTQIVPELNPCTVELRFLAMYHELKGRL